MTQMKPLRIETKGYKEVNFVYCTSYLKFSNGNFSCYIVASQIGAQVRVLLKSHISVFADVGKRRFEVQTFRNSLGQVVLHVNCRRVYVCLCWINIVDTLAVLQS